MQSSRKSSASYINRPQLVVTDSKLDNLKKRSSVGIQTENFPHIEDLCNFSIMSMEEIKEQYHSTLQFLNNCHDFMNSVFGGGLRTFGDSIAQKSFDFRVPVVPNYFNVLEFFLDQYKTSNQAVEIPSTDPFRDRNKSKSRRLQNIPNLQDKKQFMPNNIGDGPDPVKKCMEPIEVAVPLVDEAKECKNRRSISPSRPVKSEKDILRKPGHHDLNALSNTFEEILRTCNEFENKSIEYLIKTDAPLKEPRVYPQNFEQKVDSFTAECFDQGDQDQDPRRKPDWLESLANEKQLDKDITKEETPINLNSKGFNLLEYALKNCKTFLDDQDSPPTSPGFPMNHQPLNLIANRNILAENLPNILFNFQDIVSNRNKSWTVLNEAPQCQSPKKVNEMFKKISRENLESHAETNSCLEDGEEFVRFIEDDNDSLSDDDHNSCDIELCSSGSIILTDEEFQRRNGKRSIGWSQDNFEAGTLSPKMWERPQNGYIVEAEIEIPVKSNPLKLNDKDKSLADEKVLRTIGLFNEKGDIRPGVINILEEKQRMSLAQNKAKNVKFRTERKFDLEVRFNNENMRVADNTTSEESLSDNSLVSQRNMVADKSVRSSVISISTCSTISDSDILRAKPNDSQTIINKIN